METDLIRIWRFEYFTKIQIYRKNEYLILYVDETWFKSQETIKTLWSDGSKEATMDVPISKCDFTSPHTTSMPLVKKDHYVPSQFKVDIIENELGYCVLSLPLYHCVLNPVEMVCNHLRTHACQLSIL